MFEIGEREAAIKAQGARVVWALLMCAVVWGCGPSKAPPERARVDEAATVERAAKAGSPAQRPNTPETSGQTAPPKPPVAELAQPKPDPRPHTPLPDETEAELPPPAQPKAHMAALAQAFRKAASQGRAVRWLTGRAAFPFDVDGKAKAADATALEQALNTHLPKLQADVAPHTQCDAITREALLGGAAWHFMDRLGERPPKAAIARDLDRLGVSADDWMVNCYHDDAAGFTFLVAFDASKRARVRAFRN